MDCWVFGHGIVEQCECRVHLFGLSIDVAEPKARLVRGFQLGRKEENTRLTRGLLT